MNRKFLPDLFFLSPNCWNKRFFYFGNLLCHRLTHCMKHSIHPLVIYSKNAERPNLQPQLLFWSKTYDAWHIGDKSIAYFNKEARGGVLLWHLIIIFAVVSCSWRFAAFIHCQTQRALLPLFEHYLFVCLFPWVTLSCTDDVEVN